MDTSKKIWFTAEAAKLIPRSQLIATREMQEAHREVIERINAQVPNIPKLGETDGMKEHPAALHYFYGGTDIYISEWDGEDLLFGFTILNGDLECSEFGYTSLEEIRCIDLFNLDYYFAVQSIEYARYKKYPAYFKKPVSAA
jgi:hypothetical protein